MQLNPSEESDPVFSHFPPFSQGELSHGVTAEKRGKHGFISKQMIKFLIAVFVLFVPFFSQRNPL